MDQLFLRFPGIAVCRLKCHIDPPRSIDDHFNVLVNISISMTCDRDGLFPRPHGGADAVQEYRGPEDCPVKYGPNSPVRTLPHLLQSVFFDSLLIGGYRGAFDRHTIYFCRLRGLHRYPVVSLIAFLKSQVIVFSLQVNMRFKQYLLDLGPDNAGHFIPVHLHQRCLHRYFHIVPTLQVLDHMYLMTAFLRFISLWRSFCCE